MDLTLSPSEQAFRDELRAWLADNHPGEDPPGRTPPSTTGAGGSASCTTPATPASPGPRSTAAAARRSSSRRSSARRWRASARPAGQRARHGHGRPRRDPPRHRRAEGALAEADPHGRRDLVPGLPEPSRAPTSPRSRCKAVKSNGEWVVPDRRSGRRSRTRRSGACSSRDRPGRAEAPGPDLLHHGHGAGRRSGPPALPDHERAGVQRALHGGGADPRRERHRRRRQRLGGRDHHADERARRPRRGRPRPACGSRSRT